MPNRNLTRFDNPKVLGHRMKFLVIECCRTNLRIGTSSSLDIMDARASLSSADLLSASGLPISTPSETSVTITKFLVTSGSKVKEGQAVLEFQATPGARPQTFTSPIPAVVKYEATATGSTKPESITLLFCKHEALLSGKLCVHCGSDVSRLSKRALEFLHAHHARVGGGVGGANPLSGGVTNGKSTGAAATAQGAFGGSSSSSGASSTSLLPSMRSYRMQGGLEFSLTDAYAKKADSAIMRRLRSARKLTLVLDLDHTLVHAVNQPEVAAAVFRAMKEQEQQSAGKQKEATEEQNKSNDDPIDDISLSSDKALHGPTAPAAPASLSADYLAYAEGKAALPLNTVVPTHRDDMWLFTDGYSVFTIKLRPHVRRFLEEMSSLFELQVDTYGTRGYAKKIVAILDPQGKLFGDRIVSRCDSRLRHKESASWMHRSLQDDSMVLIVDDTEAMWPGARNLIVIEPYRYWLTDPAAEVNNAAGSSATAVVNAPPAPAPAPAPGKKPAEVDDNQDEEDSEYDPLSPASSASGGAGKTVAGVKRSRKELEAASGAEDDTAAITVATAPTTTTAAASTAPLIPFEDPQYLKKWGSAQAESDSYLLDVASLLRKVHAEYFQRWDAQSTASTSSSSSADAAATAATAAAPPNTSDILQSVMRSVLNGCCIVFSGVFPLQINPKKTPLYRRCLQFGACITDSVLAPVGIDHWEGSAELVDGDAPEADEEEGSDSDADEGAGAPGSMRLAGRKADEEESEESSDDEEAPESKPPQAAGATTPSAMAGEKAPKKLPIGRVVPPERSSSAGTAAPTLKSSSQGIVTHLVARLAGTQKIHDAASHNGRGIRVVSLKWLEESVKRYCRQSEALYPLDGTLPAPSAATAAGSLASPSSFAAAVAAGSAAVSGSVAAGSSSSTHTNAAVEKLARTAEEAAAREERVKRIVELIRSDDRQPAGGSRAKKDMGKKSKAEVKSQDEAYPPPPPPPPPLAAADDAAAAALPPPSAAEGDAGISDNVSLHDSDFDEEDF
jgi:FCP1-like phosphatase family protein